MAVPAIINVMSRAAEKASRSLLRDFYEVENLQVSMKGPGDFVSAADRRAEKIIYEELLKAKPKFGFLMEENGEIKGEENSRFIIDPLDGTTNFLHGIPHWSISIALEENGEVTAGLILDPVKDEMFYATKGGGAWMRGNKRLRVSGRTDLGLCIVSSAQMAISEHPKVKEVRKRFAAYRYFGGTALELAYLAAGRIDAYVEGFTESPWPAPWDLAAGMLIAKEAGAMVTEFDGSEKKLNSTKILAANERVYSQLKDILNAK